MSAVVAHQLAARGWFVLPLVPGSKRPYANCRPCTGETAPGCRACQDGRCRAAWCHAHIAATRDPAVIRRAWPTGGALVAVATEPSNLAVVDVEAAGMDYARALIRRGVLPPTVAQESASGAGMHLLYAGAVPTRIRPAIEGERRALDVKSRGAYVRWTGRLLGAHELAPFPARFGALLSAPAPVVKTPPPPPVVVGRGFCRHSAEFVARGVDMAAAYIREHAGHGAGSATYGRARAVAAAHRECPGPCGLDTIGAALVAAAVSVGVPEHYAARQVARGYGAGAGVASSTPTPGPPG